CECCPHVWAVPGNTCLQRAEIVSQHTPPRRLRQMDALRFQRQQPTFDAVRQRKSVECHVLCEKVRAYDDQRPNPLGSQSDSKPYQATHGVADEAGGFDAYGVEQGENICYPLLAAISFRIVRLAALAMTTTVDQYDLPPGAEKRFDIAGFPP